MHSATLFAGVLVLAGAPALAQNSGATSLLADLLEEARVHNPEIVAAEHDVRAAGYLARQVGTLPDPQLTVQQFSVGSPRPFAGFSNSDFAYIGFGASQEFPYPGKLRLKREAASLAAYAQGAQATELRSSVAQKVKTAYFHLAYLQETLEALEQSSNTLKQLSEAELSRYRAGQGSQGEVLKAQLERTKLIREITMHHGEMAQYQAELKLLLNRAPTSEDIVTGALTPTPLSYDAPTLMAFVNEHNPAVQSSKALLGKQDAEVRSIQTSTKPDFDVGYMYEKTGSAYRDYYMLTVGIRLPRPSRARAQISEAEEMQEKAKALLDARLQEQLSEVQRQLIAAKTATELLSEYQDGLLPQAHSVLRAHLSAFQNAQGDLSAVLTAVADVLMLERERAQALLDHEIAISQLETLTGQVLR